MNNLEKERVLKAAKTSTEATRALKELFPKYFEKYIQPGEIYTWGPDDDSECGVVITTGTAYMLVNFLSGKRYLNNLSKEATINNLSKLLDRSTFKLSSIKLKGPFKIKSWIWEEVYDD